MFLKKPLCSTQAKTNYVERFFYFFSDCLCFGEYFTFFKTFIFHNEAYYIMRGNFNEPRGKLNKSTAQKMKFSIKDFFSKCDQIAGNCGFGHIY